MEQIILIVLLVIIVVLGWFVYEIKRKQDGSQGQLAGDIKSQNELFKERFEFLDRKLADSNSQLNERFSSTIASLQRSVDGRLGQNSERLDNAARSYAKVENKITELQAATNKVFEVGKDIASLQEILRAPKIRGGFGEVMLENILSDVLAKECFSIQHRFKSGETVDAIVKLKGCLVSVDSKFPLENFQKMLGADNGQEKLNFKRAFISDVKKHVDSIASKYILPDEGTMNLALMYITAENVYSEVTGIPELAEYFRKKNVLAVSPNSLYAYLITVAMGLKGMEIEKRAREILNSLGRLRTEYGKFYRDFSVLGRHIIDTKNKYESTEKRLERFGDRLEKVEVETGEVEAIESAGKSDDKLLT